MFKLLFKILNKLSYYNIKFKAINGLLFNPYYVARTTNYQDIRQIIWKKLGHTIGKDTYINHSITILDSNTTESKIHLGERVALSPNITFILCSSPNNSLLHNISETKRYIKDNPIFIGDDSWIGTNTVIHPGVKIGKRCIIGAMSNVTKDIPDDCLAYGNPIRIIRKINTSEIK